ncbi:CoA-binding protein [Arhodomonas aquaeolei]|uniref:CoA-binding protein n=1 Tax=Arhodomonas aquaeolei TaxID=2369 RepID=UPI002167C1D6|nr:CoA-binding protein [Arhodomonas aquaeolei]MCS4504542.1 CoA-binding protein [Arhodomonas aquaeolei]
MTDTDTSLRALLQHTHTIAVVGLSPKPQRPSHGVAQYLQAHGYRVIPVNPGHETILGETSYPDLRSIPEPVDMVDVFRRPDQVAAVVEDAVAVGAPSLWLQLGVIDEAAAQRARDAGLTVVMDRCLKIEHARLIGDG